MIDAWNIGVNIELSDDILASLGRLYSEFDKVQGAVDSINGALERTGGLIAPLITQATALAGAFSQAASAAGHIQRAMAGAAVPEAGAAAAQGGGGAGGSDPLPPNVIPAPSNLPALIPGQPYYSGGDGNNSFHRSGYTPNWIPGTDPVTGLPALIPGQAYYSGQDGNSTGYNRNPYYGTGGTQGGPDSQYDPSSSPNWTPGGQLGDEPFNRPGATPLYPGSSKGGGFNPIEGYFYSQLVTSAAKDLLAKPYEDAATVDQKLEILTANGMTPDQAKKAYDDASKMREQKQFSTLTIDDLLGIEQAIFLTTKDLGVTQSLMPAAADSAIVMKGLGDTVVASQMQNLMRSADLAGVFNKKDANGKIDPAAPMKFMQDFIAVEMATGDAIDPNQFLHFYQNAGPAVLGLSDEGRQAAMLVAYSLGQQKAGTGLAQLTKSLIGGKMSIGNEKYLESVGLLNPDDVIKGSSHGGYVQMKDGAVKDEALLISDPVSWIEKNIGGATDLSNMTPDQYNAMIHKIYASANTAQSARFIGESIFQGPMIGRQLLGASGIPQLSDLALQFSNTPTGTAAGAASTTNALVVTLANSQMSLFQPMLDFFTWSANHASNEIGQHPAASSTNIDLGIIWGALKGLQTTGIFGKGFGGIAGVGADILGKIFEPLLYVELGSAAAKGFISGLTSPDAPWGERGIQAFKGDFDFVTGQGGKIGDAIEAQTQTLVAALKALAAAVKGQQTPAMPSTSTSPNPQVAPGNPGQALPNHW